MIKRNIYYLILNVCVALMLISVSPCITYATVDGGNDPEYSFILTAEVDGTSIDLIGSSEFMMTPSSYSIYMKSDKGNCSIHLLNFKARPGPGTYTVGDNERARTAILCVFNEQDPKERVVSESGTFTITSINSSSLEGHFEMILKGGISGKIYRVSGRVSSENIPSNLKF